MSFQALLVHRATVESPVEDTDRFGQRRAVQWSEKFASVPCRLDSPRGRERVTMQRAETVNEPDLLIFFDARYRPTERDRIASIVDSTGEVLATDLNIVYVKPTYGLRGRVHHFEVTAERFR